MDPTKSFLTKLYLNNLIEMKSTLKCLHFSSPIEQATYTVYSGSENRIYKKWIWRDAQTSGQLSRMQIHCELPRHSCRQIENLKSVCHQRKKDVTFNSSHTYKKNKLIWVQTQTRIAHFLPTTQNIN